MKTKGLVILLVAIIALGGGLGGAFACGMALGKSQGEEAARRALPTQSTQSAQALRQQLQRQGQLSQQQFDQFRQQFQGQQGDMQNMQGFGGRGGLAGTIEKIEGNTVTVNTPQGPLQATIGADTTVQMFAEGTWDDLKTGLSVTVMGQREEDGTVTARSIVITPEGTDGLFGGGGAFSGDRPQSR